MKSAKELFEELGYKLIENDKEEIEYKKELEFNNYFIGFWRYSKKFFKTDSCDLAIDITLDELKAINKQIEELNWNE